MNASAKELAAHFDLEKLTAEFYDDPYPTYRALRENEPVKRLRNGTVFLTRYDDLVTTYKNTKSFSSDKKREFAPKYGDTPLYEHHTTSLVFNDPPAHTRVRRLIMLEAGTSVTLCIGAANRDPAQFADPERFDVARTPNRHLAFATGAHQCAGMALARLEGAIAISRFLARFPNYAVSGQPVRGGRVRFRGFLSVPCAIG